MSLYASTSCMMTHRWRGVTRDRTKKAHSDLMFGQKTIHINIAFIRSRKSIDVEIVEAEI